jgi:copper chaperone CopZ
MKIFLSFAFSLLLFFAITPSVQAQVTDASTVTPVTNEGATSAITTVPVKVKGVGCGSDIALIKANVEKLAGVEKCEVVKHGAITSFDITYNPQEAVLKDIHAAIEDTGCCKDADARPYKVKL